MTTAARGTFTVKGCMAIFKIFRNIPSLCTPHVLQWSPRWVDIGTIHGRRNVATHHRKPLVNRTRGCRDISSSKASPWRPAGRSYSDFSTISRRTRSAFRVHVREQPWPHLSHLLGGAQPSRQPVPPVITRNCLSERPSSV